MGVKVRRIWIVVAFALGALAGASATVWWHSGLPNHRLELKAYFQNANGLRAGAPVQIAGVTIGKVTAIRAQPAHPENPAEVLMRISTPYELKIPSDATASLAVAGVLGDVFIQINTAGASGPPATSGATLKSLEPSSVTLAGVANTLKQIVTQVPCTPDKANPQPNTKAPQ